MRASAYETVSYSTVLTLQKIKETDTEIRTQRMVIISKKDGEGEPRRMNPESSTRIYVTASVETECRMIAQNWKMQDDENKIASKVNMF